jgi:hypothetical protein
MKFPNAYSGVKKLYTAEILALIGVVALLIAAFAALVMVGAAEAEEAGIGAASLGAAAVFGLIGGVLAIIAFILQIIGLNAGGKDEPLFKTALSFAVAGIVVQALASFVPSEIVQKFAETFVPVAQVLLISYVISAIRSLAEKLGNSELVEKAKGVVTVVFVTFAVQILAKVLGQFVLTGKIGGIVEIVGYVLEIVQFIVYLSYLSKAKKMLAQ